MSSVQTCGYSLYTGDEILHSYTQGLSQAMKYGSRQMNQSVFRHEMSFTDFVAVAHVDFVVLGFFDVQL